MKITSQPLTFLDTTDSRKLEVYISSNHPTIQLYDVNDQQYTPDWSETNLRLSADVFLDSKEIKPEKIQWYSQYINETTEREESRGDYTEEITVNSNMAQAVVTYICRAEYQGIQAFSKITFVRNDTGLNGKDGADGTGVTILGSYDTLSALQAAHPTGNPGDAYIIGAYLYVWAVDDAEWENVGRIQGPAGKDAKSIVLTGNAQVFKVGKTNVYTPSTISVTATPINTTITEWSYSVNGGQTFLSDAPTGVVRNGNVVTITGLTLVSNSLVIKASDGSVSDVFTVYKAFDGADGTPGNPGSPASMAFLTNENISFSANSNGEVALTTFTTNVVSYNGTTKVTPTIGTISGLPSGMTVSDPITSANEQILTFTIAKDSNLGSASSNNGTITIPITAPVNTNLILSWSKINSGARGETGEKGNDAYTVILTNESHVFAGDISNAVAGSATTQVLAYNGSAQQDVTIISVNGKTAAIVDTDTGLAGLKFKCSALTGKSQTITFTCTTAFTSANGSIPIVLSVGGVSITKIFTYSIAFKGAAGGQGSQGNPGSPATAYWLVSSAGVVQKTASGTAELTPSTLTFTGKSKTGTSAPIDYGCRWIISYSTDGTNYINAYTSTANETSKEFAVDSTYKAVRVRMYLAGGTTTLLDEQIIPVVTDGTIGAPGADAVTFQIYSSNGYALSTNTPTVTLQTFAYVGDIEITAGATYQWYEYNDAGWSVLTNATNAYLTISRENVEFSKSYMCKMTFNGVEYTSVATIDDKNDENKVFTSKPSNYVAGDLWIVGVDYVPNGVEVGTLLKAEHTNISYADADWTTATKYDDKIDNLQSNIDTYNQYFSFDATNGVTISARDANGVASQFSTSLTNERLSFNYGNESIAYINGTRMNIKEAEIESPLTVTGKYSGSTMLQAPVINIGNFSIIVESNGSLSIVANT